MMTVFLDQKKKQDLVHHGWKKELTGAFADTEENIEDPKEVSIELQLMEPSWFGFLVDNIFLEKKRNMKISKLADLSQKFFSMSDKRLRIQYREVFLYLLTSRYLQIQVVLLFQKCERSKVCSVCQDEKVGHRHHDEELRKRNANVCGIWPSDDLPQHH